MKFEEELKERTDEIERMIEKYLPVESGAQKIIMEAMNYSIKAGGKRLRPMLIMETYHLFGGLDLTLIEPFMAAMEMIHTYSLVHDDLPAMDNDEYRRGRKTTHIVYGEAMGILAGDGLLNYAFETASKIFGLFQENDSPEVLKYYQRAARALEILSSKAGIYGMIGGQVMDVQDYDGIKTLEWLNQMYHMKTGALIEASMMIGAVLAGADDERIQKIEKIAGLIGLAFQIKDDILDVTSSVEVLGKPIHSDEKNEKITYITLLGLEKANEEVTRISEKAIQEFDSLGFSNDYLRTLILELINRKK